MTFELVCEIEPPTRPDLMHVRHQIGTLSKVADTFLIPDNHLGRATVSSVAVAHEVEAMGGRSIACLNSRDRNLLGFRRDLLTAASYHVDQFLFVYGDKPSSGNRTGELTVRENIRLASGLHGMTNQETAEAFDELNLSNLAVWTLEQIRAHYPQDPSVNRPLARMY